MIPVWRTVLAIAGTLLLHGAGGTIIWVSVQPDAPVQAGTARPVALDLATYDVPRQSAALQEAAAQPTQGQAVQGARAGRGAVPVQKVSATVPAGTRLPASAPATAPVATSAPQVVQPPSVVAGDRLDAATPAGAQLAAAVPAAQPLPVAQTDPSPAPSARPVAQPLARATPPEERADPAQPQVQRGRASAIWSGSASSLDPVSFAAISAFAQPGTPAGAELRDGLSATLNGPPCARLQTEFDPDTGQLVLRGHVPEAEARGPLVSALQAQVGRSIPVADNLRVLPRPQCGVLLGLEQTGLPQSSDQRDNPRIVGPDTQVRNYQFVEGQKLSFDLTGADYPAFVYIDFYDADGAVLHLQPNEYVPPLRLPAHQPVVIGGAGGLDLRAAPPFGLEVMVAFATSSLLDLGARPLTEPAGAYLDMLRDAVREARAADPAFKGEWVYFFVETRARSR
ncbi:DUF4384 domain-containing protein [Pseudooceanicola sp. C21-150M6]|uniref:DUF4384 domain-containing protein n=1 Tax=Pseudooceanicola sp. C21-150M6 TaxID=3434355 RepID=UPI003D7F4290